MRSTCNSRHVGAVIVKNGRIIATGFNGALHNAPHCNEKSETKPHNSDTFCLRRAIGATDAQKYQYCAGNHAEANAITQASRFGIALDGAELYSTLEPCNWCIKQMVQSGITTCYYSGEYETSHNNTHGSVDGNRSADIDVSWRRSVIHNGFTLTQIEITPDTVRQAERALWNTSGRRILWPKQ